MSGGPDEVPPIPDPSWLSQDFPAEGKLSDKLSAAAAFLGDWSSKGADFADALGNLLDFSADIPSALGDIPLFDVIGVAGTVANQWSESTVKNPVLRTVEVGIAGAIDFFMGKTPLGPFLPAADSLVSAKFDISAGDAINNGLRAGFTALEGLATGDRQGTETLQAKALVGEYGKTIKGILGG